MRRNLMYALFSLIALNCLLIAVPAEADIIEGDFEAGGFNWATFADPSLSVTFPAAGGNPGGYAHMQSEFDSPGGVACISQTFVCGDPDSGTECTIGFDYKLTLIDAAPGTARIVVTIDGVSSVVVDHATQDWQSVSYVVPCGVHVIEICMEVAPQNNAWAACIDNVRAECTGGVANDQLKWDGMKSMYR